MLNCVDLFSGAGGFTLAAIWARLRVRLAIKNDKHAIETFSNNLCQRPLAPKLLENDITEINASKAYRDAFPDGDQCDLMLGGPPCQGFSTHRINDAGVDDKRNDLIHTYFDFVRAFSPSLFLMENVPGMLWDRHAAALRRFYLEGALAGYHVCPSSKQMGLLSVFHKGGYGSSLFDVKPLGVDGSSGGFGWSVF